VDSTKPGDKLMALGDSGDQVRDLQKDLIEYGYGLDETGRYDSATREVVTAFQRHFRPARVDGMVDDSTLDALRRLLQLRKDPTATKVSALDAVLRRPHP